MKLAKIVDNMPYCPICDMLLGNMTGNYDSVEHEGRLRKYYRITKNGLLRIREFKNEWKELSLIAQFVVKENK